VDWIEASLIVATLKLKGLAAAIYRCAIAVHRFVRLLHFLGISWIQTPRLWPCLVVAFAPNDEKLALVKEPAHRDHLPRLRSMF
jgi:hypothetical protein